MTSTVRRAGAQKGVPQPRKACPECGRDLPRNVIPQHLWFSHQKGQWAKRLPFHLRPTKVT